MHKITMKAGACFNSNTQFFESNTGVNVFDNKTTMVLFGNRILWKDNTTGTIYFCLCGWDTKTTCERLRGAGLPINHKRGQLYFDEQQIDDCATYKIENDKAIKID